MTSLRKPIPRERFLQLDWSGPYLLREGSLSEHPAEPQELPEETAGLYLVTSDFPLRGPTAIAARQNQCMGTLYHGGIALPDVVRPLGYLRSIYHPRRSGGS